MTRARSVVPGCGRQRVPGPAAPAPPWHRGTARQFEPSDGLPPPPSVRRGHRRSDSYATYNTESGGGTRLQWSCATPDRERGPGRDPVPLLCVRPPHRSEQRSMAGRSDRPAAHRHQLPSLGGRRGGTGGAHWPRPWPVAGLRRNLGSGLVIYSGFYSTASPPGHGPCVKTVFPVVRGNATVLLRPEAQPDGSLRLISSGRRFGDPGFYRITEAGPGRLRVWYVRGFHEIFHVYPDRDGSVRTDHFLRWWGLSVLNLHYHITLAGQASQAAGSAAASSPIR